MSALPDFCPNGELKTDKTDKTEIVSCNDFLSAIFPKLDENVRPVVVSVKGHPNHTRNWKAYPWDISASSFSEAHNNYFSLATFLKNDNGAYKRQKKYFNALHAIMLDDIGKKVPLDRLTLKPSWRIETSPGNFQYGYIFVSPLTDRDQAERLMNAIIKNELTDAGANGPSTRLARLPVGANGKYQPAFSHCLREWNPDTKYTVNQLVAGLNLTLPDSSKPKAKRASSNRLEHEKFSDQVWFPRPNHNPVLQKLKELGLYKSEKEGGKHEITCPWVSEHTNAEDGGTDYFEPSESSLKGGFHCFHGHCQHRTISDLLAKLDIKAGTAKMKPVIFVAKGEIHQVIDAAERELALSGQYFQRAGQLVTIVTDPGSGNSSICAVTEPALTYALSKLIDWEEYSSEEIKKIDPPVRHVSTLLQKQHYDHLPVLNGLARQPYLRSDGTIRMEPGYDESAGLFGVFRQGSFSVPDSPGLDDAKSALTRLSGLLDEFAFLSEHSRSATLAAILTAVLRPSLETAPMFHVRAHSPGSGKSYLCQLISVFASGKRSVPTSFPKDEDECRKLLIGELFSGTPVIEFDNLTCDLLPHNSLCSSLSSSSYRSRLLGTHKSPELSTRVLFLSSGNNVGPIHDMARRCITIGLDPDEDLPAARSFNRPNLVEEVAAVREEWVSAVLTIVRAWFLSGSPKQPCRPVAGYEQWSKACREPLIWLGYPDPAISIFEAMQEDPGRALLEQFVNAWRRVFGNASATVSDAVSRVMLSGPDHEDLKEVLKEISDGGDTINTKKIGHWLKKHAGRRVNALRIIEAGGNTSRKVWRVESVSSVL